MTKLKQVSNAFDCLYSRENNPGIGDYSGSQGVVYSSPLARTDFIELREPMPELRTIGQEVRDFLIR